jgi:hypothetical protein
MTFAILFILIGFSTGFQVYDTLGEWPKDGFTNWTYIPFKQDHSNRQPNQPPSLWTNLTFRIPYKTVAVQFTDADHFHLTQEIPYYAVDEFFGKIYVSFRWWGPPWTLYVGWSD